MHRTPPSMRTMQARVGAVQFARNNCLAFVVLSLLASIGVLSLYGDLIVVPCFLSSFLISLLLIRYIAVVSHERLLSHYLISSTVLLSYLTIGVIIRGPYGFCTSANPDSVTYYLRAQDGGIRDAIQGAFNTGGYDLFNVSLASIFNLSGDSLILGIVVFQATLLGLLPVIGYAISRRVFSSKIATISFLLILFDPICLRFSTCLMRDGLVALMAAFVALGYITSDKKSFFLFICSTPLVLLITSVLRSKAVVICGVVLLISLMFRQASRRYLLLSTIFATILPVVTFYAIDWIGDSVLSNRLTVEMSSAAEERWIDRLSSVESGQSSGLLSWTSKLPYLGMRGPARGLFAWLIPLPPIQCLFVPEDRLFDQLLIDLGGLFWHALLPMSFVGFVLGMKGGSTRPIALMWLTSILAMGFSGWVDLRWRLMGTVFLFLLIPVGMEKVSRTPILKACCAGYYLAISLATFYYGVSR